MFLRAENLYCCVSFFTLTNLYLYLPKEKPNLTKYLKSNFTGIPNFIGTLVLSAFGRINWFTLVTKTVLSHLRCNRHHEDVRNHIEPVGFNSCIKFESCFH